MSAAKPEPSRDPYTGWAALGCPAPFISLFGDQLLGIETVPSIDLTMNYVITDKCINMSTINIVHIQLS